MLSCGIVPIWSTPNWTISNFSMDQCLFVLLKNVNSFFFPSPVQPHLDYVPLNWKLERNLLGNLRDWNSDKDIWRILEACIWYFRCLWLLGSTKIQFWKYKQEMNHRKIEIILLKLSCEVIYSNYFRIGSTWQHQLQVRFTGKETARSTHLQRKPSLWGRQNCANSTARLQPNVRCGSFSKKNSFVLC